LVGVRRALLTDTDDDVDEAAVVLDALERATLGLLLLFLLGNLGGLATNLSSANANANTPVSHCPYRASRAARDRASHRAHRALLCDATDDRRAKP